MQRRSGSRWRTAQGAVLCSHARRRLLWGQGSICRQCRVEMGANLLEDIGMHCRFPDVFAGTNNENDGVNTELYMR